MVMMALLMSGRGVERAEVIAVLLFVPVFLAFVAFDFIGGFIAALAATAIYVLLRWSAIDAVGGGQFSGLIIGHALGYLLFGMVGGVANHVLRQSLEKLDEVDIVDDATGLNNSKFFLETTALEISRATRYQSTFSVVTFDIPAATLESLGRAKRSQLLNELGKMLRGGVRSADRVVIGHNDTVYRVAAILPETGREGAGIFAGRLVDRVGAFLLGYGVAVPREAAVTATFPGDEAAIERLRQEFSMLASRRLRPGVSLPAPVLALPPASPEPSEPPELPGGVERRGS